jgi:hypothetical protein
MLLLYFGEAHLRRRCFVLQRRWSRGLSIRGTAFKSANHRYTIMLEHFFLMRRIWQLRRKVLTWEVQLLMQVRTPFGTIRHIIYETMIGNVLARAAFTTMTAQLEFRYRWQRSGHRLVHPIL